MNGNLVIKTDQLTKTFGSFTAVNEISFEVCAGEIFGFLGANGAGKTTAIRMLCGLLMPSAGTAFIGGYDVYTQAEAIKKNIGYMSQKFSLYEDLSVQENIWFFGGIYGIRGQRLKEKAKALTDKLGLSRETKKMAGTLPLGWKQKLAFSLAILHEPKIVFLDEPTGGVDPVTRRQFWDLIYEAADKGITVFVSTHYMDEAAYCDRVSIMAEGQIRALDSPLNLKVRYNASSMDEIFYQIARNSDNKPRNI